MRNASIVLQIVSSSAQVGEIISSMSHSKLLTTSERAEGRRHSTRFDVP